MTAAAQPFEPPVDRVSRRGGALSQPRFGRPRRTERLDDESHLDDYDVRDCVVVGCDGATDSDAALRFAVREASLRSSRLVVLAGYQACIDPDIDDYDTPDKVLRARAVAKAEISLCRALGCGPGSLPPHRIIVGEGLPSRILLRQCADAALIVLGSHHRNALKRLFAGHGTSRQLIRHGLVPVVVVPADSANG